MLCAVDPGALTRDRVTQVGLTPNEPTISAEPLSRLEAKARGRGLRFRAVHGPQARAIWATGSNRAWR